MGTLSSHEINNIFNSFDKRNCRKLQGDHILSNNEVDYFKKSFMERYPSSIIIIEYCNYNIGTYMVKFSDADFCNIIRKNIEKKKEKLHRIEKQQIQLSKEIIQLTNQLNDLNF